MRSMFLVLLGSVTSGCPLLVSDPPTEFDTESASSSTGSSGLRYECSDSAYSCKCEVSPDGVETLPACYPTVAHTADVCCASPSWPMEGSCGCVVLSCSSFGNDECQCEEGLTDGSESCSSLGASCATVSGCRPADSDQECTGGETFLDAPCAVGTIPCPSGQVREADCDGE